jgi:hypothetical protein
MKGSVSIQALGGLVSFNGGMRNHTIILDAVSVIKILDSPLLEYYA